MFLIDTGADGSLMTLSFRFEMFVISAVYYFYSTINIFNINSSSLMQVKNSLSKHDDAVVDG